MKSSERESEWCSDIRTYAGLELCLLAINAGVVATYSKLWIKGRTMSPSADMIDGQEVMHFALEGISGGLLYSKGTMMLMMLMMMMMSVSLPWMTTLSTLSFWTQ